MILLDQALFLDALSFVSYGNARVVMCKWGLTESLFCSWSWASKVLRVSPKASLL